MNGINKTNILCTTVTLVFGLALHHPFQQAKAAQNYQKPAKEVLEKKLSKMQFFVTQENGTEPAFHNAYFDNKKPGIYVDVVSNEPLFSSLDKFDSKSGWPSFTRPLELDNVKEHVDLALGMRRVEVRSRLADSHLGHVFPDGPRPTGLRYCINSAALRFIPAHKLKQEGFGQYGSLFGIQRPIEEEAILAGGCLGGRRHPTARTWRY